MKFLILFQSVERFYLDKLKMWSLHSSQEVESTTLALLSVHAMEVLTMKFQSKVIQVLLPTASLKKR